VIEIREFREEDQNKLEALEPLCMYMSAENLIGPAYTFLDEERVICVCGIQILWKGVGEAWAMVDKSFGKAVRAPARIQALLDYRMAKHELWRVQSHMMAHWSAGQKFIRHLGFKQETTEPLRKFFWDGSDCFIYARVL